MASIPVTIVGVMTYTGLEIGGGPIVGGPGGGLPGYRPEHPIYWPPVIAGGPGWLPPFPAHPIAPGGPPPTVMPPIYYPPQIWPDPRPPGGGPPVYPSHPIYWPPVISGGPGSLPPFPAHPIAPGGQPPGGVTPPEGWHWAYSPVYGWVMVPGNGGKPVPPGGEQPPDQPDAPVVNPLPSP